MCLVSFLVYMYMVPGPVQGVVVYTAHVQGGVVFKCDKVDVFHTHLTLSPPEPEGDGGLCGVPCGCALE